MIRVFEDQEAASAAAADLFVQQCRQAIGARGRFSVALSGGHTPRRMYQLLALPPRAEQVNWQDIQVFWGDERCVAPDDDRNNAALARKELLDKVAIPVKNLHPISCEKDARAEAARYATLLKKHSSESSSLFPVLDLVFLGLGQDGHTASLFPSRSEQTRDVRSDSWVIAVPGDEQQIARISLTPTIINNAGLVVFLVFGENKAHILQRVVEGLYDPFRLPAQMMAPGPGRLVWLLDRQAASRLTRVGDGR